MLAGFFFFHGKKFPGILLKRFLRVNRATNSSRVYNNILTEFNSSINITISRSPPDRMITRVAVLICSTTPSRKGWCIFGFLYLSGVCVLRHHTTMAVS